MTWEAWFTLAIVVVVFAGLVRSIASPDVLLMGAAVVMGLAGIITPKDVFAGFANEGVLTVAALFVVAAALRETGAIDVVAGRVLGRARTARGAMLRLTGPVVGMSAFLNNTPVVAILVPAVCDWCRRHRVSPSRLLLPISYLAILGGTCTLVGTSTNLVINGLMTVERGGLEGGPLRSIALFEPAYVGLPFALVGAGYLFVVGRRLVPDRKDLLEQVGETSREYMVDMKIEPHCRLAGQTVEQAGLRHLSGLFLIEIARGRQVISPVGPDEILQAGDRLAFAGVVSTIVELERIPGLIPSADEAYEQQAAARRSRRLWEAVISPACPAAGKSIRDANFRALYNAAVVAVHRGSERLQGRIGDIVLRAGDTVLLQAAAHFEQAHRNNVDFVLVSRLAEARPVRHDRMLISVLILTALVVLMATGTVPIVLAAFLAAGLMVATRSISASDARQSINWQVLITIAAAFGLGKAIENCGLARLVAGGLFGATEAWGPLAALAATYLITVLFTELITNNAAAVLVWPFAMAMAEVFGVSARPFAMAVLFAASASFATPIGYQTNMMVYGPGGYRFADFLRIGLPLSIVLFIVAILLIPTVWPF